MKLSGIFSSLLLFLSLISISGFKEPAQKSFECCISDEEYELYTRIMEYRKSKKLPLIPLSNSLTFVAKTHAKDLMENRPDKNNCNMHSWSKKGTWKSCCYTPDHKQASCMWSKPKELTNYPSEGFEIVYTASRGVDVKSALEGWKKSNPHNAVITNSGMWKKEEWDAIGVGINGNYATVWFGMFPDPAGEPQKCSK